MDTHTHTHALHFAPSPLPHSFQTSFCFSISFSFFSSSFSSSVLAQPHSTLLPSHVQCFKKPHVFTHAGLKELINAINKGTVIGGTSKRLTARIRPLSVRGPTESKGEKKEEEVNCVPPLNPSRPTWQHPNLKGFLCLAGHKKLTGSHGRRPTRTGKRGGRGRKKGRSRVECGEVKHERGMIKE